MERDPSQTLYTVALTGVRDESSQLKLADTLSSVSGRLPMEAVLKRLNALPWTLTRKASYKRAYRLAKLLESLGGEVQCVPPLPKSSKPLMDETQILYGAGLLSQTQVMSETQFIPRPDEPPAPKPATAPAVSAPEERSARHETPAVQDSSAIPAPAAKPSAQVRDAEAKKDLVKKHVWTVLIGLLIVASAVGSVMLMLFFLFLLGWIS